MEILTSENLLPGFSDPIFDSQRTFRQVLKAMSYPGRVIPLEMAIASPHPLYSTTAAICLTLLDPETPLWMDRSDLCEITDWLRFHCGCPLVDSPSHATFGLLTQGFEERLIDQFPVGEEEFPERSATLLVQVSGFQAGAGRSFKGPGIKTEERLEVHGLLDTFWKAWQRNQRLYPLGVDALFISPSALVGLPRTIEVRE